MASAQVLVIEDNPRVGGKLVEVLQRQGFDALLVGDASAALAAFRARRPDIVLLDQLVSPAGGGPDLLTSLRALDDEVPVVLMSTSAAAGHQITERGGRPPQGFLLKPFRVAELLATLGTAVDSRPGAALPAEHTPQRAGVLTDAARLESTLLALVLEGATGVLRLDKGGVRRALYLVNGLPVYAESNLVGETLGRYLISRGVLTREQYLQVQAHLRSAGGRQGEALVALGILGHHEVYAQLRGQVRERLVRCMDWPGAAWTFHAEDSFVDDKLLFPMNPVQLIIEGTARRLGPQRLYAWFDAHRHQRVVPTRLADQLAPYLSRLLRDPPLPAVLATRPTVEEIAGTLRLVDTRAAAILRTLVDVGAVDVRGPGLSADEPFAALADETIVALTDEATAPTDDQPGDLELEDPRLNDDTHTPPGDPVARQVFARYLATRGDDHFAVLGLARDADRAAVEAAWLDFSRAFHPDAFAQHADPEVRARAQEVFVRAGVAFGALIDDDRRAAHRAALLARSPDGTRRRMDAESHYQEGERLLAEGAPAAAREAFARAHADDPAEPLYAANLGWASFAAATDDAARSAAERLLRDAVGRDPANPTGHALLARVCQATGRPGEAADLQARADSLAPPGRTPHR